MATIGGPNTEKDGLVFGFDTGYGVADNNTATRFYPGEPAENLVAGANLINRVAGTFLTDTLVDGVRILENNQVNNSHIMWNGAGGFTVTCSAGKYITVSAEYKTSCTVHMRFRDYPYDAGGNINTISEVSTDIPNTQGEWVRYSLTAQTTTANPHLWWYLVDYRSNNQFGRVEIRNTQIEIKSHSTPYVLGTRSSTQSLIDLKRTTDIDVTNVSFDSTGQPSFDGSDDKIELSNYLTNLDTSLLSLEFVFRTNIGTGTFQPLLGWHYGRAGHGYVCLGNFTGHWGNESISFYNEGTGATPLSFAYTNGHSFLGDTNYHHAVVILQTNNYRIFVDGEEVGVNASFRNGSQSTVMQSNLFGYGTGPKVGIGVGSQTEAYLSGRIPITKIYNRALSASEITQNFNAYKNRFDI